MGTQIASPLAFYAALCELDRDLDELRNYIGRNSDRISPMLPGGTPKTDPPPQSSRRVSDDNHDM